MGTLPYSGGDGSVGTTTPYELDGPGIESRRGTRFSGHVQNVHGDHPDSYTMGTGSFPGVKQRERGVDHQSPSGISWPVVG